MNKFSASTKGFYPVSMMEEYKENGTLPDDVHDVSADDEEAIRGALANRQIVEFDGVSGWKIWPKQPDAAELRNQAQAAAKEALIRSDVTIVRCYEASIQVPDDWRVYRDKLRMIISAEIGVAIDPLPDQPDYPAGT